MKRPRFSTLQIGSLIEATLPGRQDDRRHSCFSTLQIGSLIEAIPNSQSAANKKKFQYPSNRVVDRSDSVAAV